MASALSSFDSQHEDMIHDAQMDFFGKRIATCSSDRTIKIFEYGDNNVLLAELKGHEGPVWQVAWAHPKYGSLLASCSYDRKVFIWKETANNVWTRIYEYDKHESSVNSISWAPHEFGLSLACASSDCSISILALKGDNTWDVQKINQAHAIGVNAVSWAPAVSPGSLISSSAPTAPPVKRLVSGGCDNLIKIWRFSETENIWKHEETLEQQHTDWVRDVAWAPNIGLPSSTIASCSQDGTVVIWTQDNTSSTWSKKILPKFPDVVWRVSWSITGNILAVAGGDNKVTLWKESLDSEWKCISALSEEGETNTASPF
jgi:protein transport protein SEC13